jgi:hypothetical protein
MAAGFALRVFSIAIVGRHDGHAVGARAPTMKRPALCPNRIPSMLAARLARYQYA